MSRCQWTVVDWDWPRLEACVLDVDGARSEVVAVDRVTVADEPARGGEREAAAWLKAVIESSGSGPRKLAIVFPRDRVTLRRFDVPAVDDGSLPDIVALQVAAQSGLAPHDVCVDFVTQDDDRSSTGRAAYAVSIPSTTKTLVDRVADAAGLPLDFVGVSAFCLAALIAEGRGDDDQDFVAGVFFGPHRTESVLCRGRELTAANCRREDGAVTAARLGAETRRLRLADDRLAADRHLEVLTDRYEMAGVPLPSATVRQIDASALPVASNDLPGDSEARPLLLLIAAGAVAAATAGSTRQVNLAAPRRAVPPVDRRRQAVFAGAAAAVLLCGGGLWWWLSTTADLDDRIATTTRNLGGVSEFVETHADDVALREAVESRLDRGIPIGERFGELLDALPGRSRLLLSGYEVRAEPGETRFRVTAEGVAVDTREPNALNEKIAAEGYRVRPKATDTLDDGSRYGVGFTLDYSPARERQPSRSTRRRGANANP